MRRRSPTAAARARNAKFRPGLTYTSGESPARYSVPQKGRGRAVYNEGQMRAETDRDLPHTAWRHRKVPDRLQPFLVPGEAFFLRVGCEKSYGDKGSAFPLLEEAYSWNETPDFPKGTMAVYVCTAHRDEKCTTESAFAGEYGVVGSNWRAVYPVFLIDGARYLIADLEVLQHITEVS